MVAGGVTPGFLTTVLSTITSPLPLTVVVVYWEDDVGCSVYSRTMPVRVDLTPTKARKHRKRFKVLAEIYRVREFQLVLCADVLDRVAEYAMQVLEHVVKGEKVNGGLSYLLSEPLVISEMRSPRTRLGDDQVGWEVSPHISASAL